MSGSYCRSLYPFSGQQHQQGLGFEVGDVIKVVQALPGGWWEGERDGATGWFPSSYVQVLEVRTTVFTLMTLSLISIGDVDFLLKGFISFLFSIVFLTRTHAHAHTGRLH